MALVSGKDIVKLRMDIAKHDGSGNIAELNYKHVVSDKEEMIFVERVVTKALLNAYDVIGDEALNDGK